MNPFDEAIKAAGSATLLAAETGFSRQAINKARKRGTCDAKMARAIETATRVAKERLVFGDEPKSAKRRKAA